MPSHGVDTYTALMLMQNLLRILQYLQSKNVIHNDIKGTVKFCVTHAGGSKYMDGVISGICDFVCLCFYL